jgi:hypothetical protein
MDSQIWLSTVLLTVTEKSRIVFIVPQTSAEVKNA